MYANQHWGHTGEMDYLRRRAEERLQKARTKKTSEASEMEPLSRSVQREILRTQRARLRRHGQKTWTRNGV